MPTTPVTDGLESRDECLIALVTKSFGHTMSVAKTQRFDQFRIAEWTLAFGNLMFLAEVCFRSIGRTCLFIILFRATGSQHEQSERQEHCC